MPDYCFSIDPLDPLLFGDNRSARAGSDHLQLDQDPSPLTIHGALGRFIETCNMGCGWPTATLGPRVEDVLSIGQPGQLAELLGYTFRDDQGRRWYPRPLHFRCRTDGPTFFPADILFPKPAPQPWAASSCEFDHYLIGDEIEEPEETLLVSEELLAEILCGRTCQNVDLERHGFVRRISDVFRPEPRGGIGMDNDSNSVEQGMLFTRPYRRFSAGSGQTRTLSHGFDAWMRTLAPLPDGLSGKTGFLGGDRRRARFFVESVTEAEGPLSAILEKVKAEADKAKGFLLYFLTPFIRSTAPLQVKGCHALASATGKPLCCSGWNSATGAPRPILALVPAGSVFFFEWPRGEQKASLIDSSWLASFCTGHAAGFGRALVGVWQ
jgi:hypothetical protein